MSIRREAITKTYDLQYSPKIKLTYQTTKGSDAILNEIPETLNKLITCMRIKQVLKWFKI
jgi:hypothetical protein